MNKKVIALAAVIPLVLGTVSTASAVEKEQVSLEKYSPKEKAIEYLKENATHYALKEDLSDLRYISTTETPVASYVRFQQVVNDAPVFSRQITVTINRAGQSVLVVSDYQPVQRVKEIKKR